MRLLGKGLGLTVAMLLVFVFLAWPLYAQPGAAPAYPSPGYSGQKTADTWEFTIIPYGWFTGISGDINVKNRRVHVSIGFDDIWDNLDFAGLAQFEARRGRWGMFLQPNYLKLSPTASLSRPLPADLTGGGPSVLDADVRLDSRTLIVEFGGFYRLAEWGRAGTCGSGTFDVVAGGRYWYLQNHISLSLPQAGYGFSDTSYGNIIDPIVGFRTLTYFAPKFFFTLRGDAGGFGVSSDSSHISWNGVGTVGLDISKCAAIMAGYRYLYINRSTSGGAGIKANFQGPVIGFSYKF